MSIDKKKKKISRSNREKRRTSRFSQQREKIQRYHQNDKTLKSGKLKLKLKKMRSSQKKDKSRRRTLRVNPYLEKWSWKDLTMADTQYLESDLESITHVHESFSVSISPESPSTSPSPSPSPSQSSSSSSSSLSLSPPPSRSLSPSPSPSSKASATLVEPPINIAGSGPRPRPRRGDKRPSRAPAPSPPSRRSPNIPAATRRLSPNSPAHSSSAPISSAPVSPALLSPAALSPAALSPAAISPAPLSPALPISAQPLSAPLSSAVLLSAPLLSAPLLSAPLSPAPLSPAPSSSAPPLSAPLSTAVLLSASLSPAPLAQQVEEPLEEQALIDATSLNETVAQIREWTDRMDSFVLSTENRFGELQSTLEHIRAEMRDGKEDLLMFLQDGLNEIKARLLQPTVSFHGTVIPTQHVSLNRTVVPAQPPLRDVLVPLQPLVRDAFIAHPFEREESEAPSIASWYTAPNPEIMADLEGTSLDEVRTRETSSVLSSPPPIGEDTQIWPAGHDIEANPFEEELQPVDWSFLNQPSSPVAQSDTGTSQETSHGVSSDDTLLQNRLEQMISISRLSSGVESLPTSCRSSVSPPPFTQHVLPTVRRSLRTPTKSIDYVHHPMDSAKRRAQKNANLARIQSSASAKSASTRSGGISERDLRGVSVHSREISTLLPSDGARTGAKWPRQGANTVKGRMEEIACDMCHGRVHWACAGLEDRDSLKNEPWACPDCRVISSRYNNSEDEDEDHTYIEVERAQQERCLRPNCVWRSRRRIVRKQQDEDTFYIEAILGRRATGRRIYSTNKRVWEYLVKWHDWELWDATWEPAQHIPDLEYYQSHFVQAAKKADVDISRKVVLLPGVLEWYDEDGDRLDKKLTEMGIEPRTWWQDK